MHRLSTPFELKGNFIDGRFRRAQELSGEWVARSPSDTTYELGTVTYSYLDVAEAVDSARRAFQKWRKLPVSERASFLKAFQGQLSKRADSLVEMIALESGKPLWEAKTELSAMINKVDITLTDSLQRVKDYEIPQILDRTLGACRYRPLGVMAVVGPFNFPGHLPNGHIVPALLTGNTVVFKPSEKTPGVGQLMAECFLEAGFPPGVFNLVQGEKEVGRRLCVHEGVNGVLFTGSYEVGTRIKQDTLLQHWKLLALEMGGKNAAIVWDDAPFDLAVFETLVGAFITAGQRCSATSRILVHEKISEKFVSEFHKHAKAFKIGHPFDHPFMGPLIDQASTDRYMKFLGIAQREGFEVVMRGKALELPYAGNYVTPTICWSKQMSVEQARKSVYQQTELFAPNVAIIEVRSIEEATELANVTQYGLVSSIFTKSQDTYRALSEDLEFGLINWNKSTVGASSRLPFGGLKKSGNHLPTALTATDYCTYPVASLEVSEPSSVSELAGKTPGLNWS